MRNLSFSLTKDSFLNGTKDVTRRYWKEAWVKPGDHMMGVEKAQGLKKGEKIVRLGEIEILEIAPERVDEIILHPLRHKGNGKSEMVREGFPAFTPERFVEFFCRANKVTPDTIIYRLGFRHVE